MRRTKQICVRVTEREFERALSVAARLGLDMQNAIRHLLQREYERMEAARGEHDHTEWPPQRDDS